MGFLSYHGIVNQIQDVVTELSANRVQYKLSNYSFTPSVTLDITPVEGNLLVAYVSNRSSLTDATMSGWNKVTEYHALSGDSTYRRAIALFWKIAGESESASISASWTNGGSANFRFLVQEFEILSGGTFEYLEVNSNDNGATADATAISTGSISPTGNNILAIAFGLNKPRTSGSVTSSLDFDNDFANEIILPATSSSGLDIGSGFNTYFEGTTISSTATLGGSGYNSNGLIASIAGFRMTGIGGGETPFEVDINYFGSLSTAQNKWFGGVLAPNGLIYSVPLNISSILVIDPSDNSTSTFGSVGASFSWAGGVLAPNGKIYCIPYNDTEVLVIDPSDNSTYTFGSFSGSAKWVGGVLAPNGKIYGIPADSSTVLEIDPTADTGTTFGSVGGGSTKWGGGILATNGKIYCVPTNEDEILVIDPSDNSTYTFGATLAGSDYKFTDACLAFNNKIYMLPYSGTYILEIDPSDDSTDTFGSFSGNFKWQGARLSPNGNIFTGSADGANLLELNPVTRATTLHDTKSGSLKWSGLVLAPNGHMYAIPRFTNEVMEIITTDTPQDSGDNSIPVDLNDLATSNYNKYHNKF